MTESENINAKKVKRFREIANELADLYSKKNRNYGDSFGQLYKMLGPISGLVPLHNKLDRATNLIKGGTNYFESIEDTLRDLASYSIMNLIEMEYSRKDNQTGWWNKQREDVVSSKLNSSSGTNACISMEDFWNDIKSSLEKSEEEVEYSNEH